VEAQEFGLVRNMLIAAVEERYKDAGNDPFVLCIHSIHPGLHIEHLTMIPPVLSYQNCLNAEQTSHLFYFATMFCKGTKHIDLEETH
jgi:hypothetical protein